MTVRGEDRKNRVLLLLHGGPGDATNPCGYAGFRNWLKYFTVVQWDQRGAGRTFGRNGEAAASTITVERMVQDVGRACGTVVEAVAEGQNRSRGAFLGLHSGSFHSEGAARTFYAFAGTGQVADPARNYAVARAALVERASREGNSRALQELNEVGPPPYKDGRGFAVQRKGESVLKERTCFLHPRWGSRYSRPRTRWATSTTGLKDRA